MGDISRQNIRFRRSMAGSHHRRVQLAGLCVLAALFFWETLRLDDAGIGRISPVMTLNAEQKNLHVEGDRLWIRHDGGLIGFDPFSGSFSPVDDKNSHQENKVVAGLQTSFLAKMHWDAATNTYRDAQRLIQLHRGEQIDEWKVAGPSRPVLAFGSLWLGARDDHVYRIVNGQMKSVAHLNSDVEIPPLVRTEERFTVAGYSGQIVQVRDAKTTTVGIPGRPCALGAHAERDVIVTRGERESVFWVDEGKIVARFDSPTAIPRYEDCPNVVNVQTLIYIGFVDGILRSFRSDGTLHSQLILGAPITTLARFRKGILVRTTSHQLFWVSPGLLTKLSEDGKGDQ